MTSVRCKIRHILADYNADRKDLFSANCGPPYLKQVPLSDIDRFVIKQLWSEFQDHQARLQRADRENQGLHRQGTQTREGKPERSSRQLQVWDS